MFEQQIIREAPASLATTAENAKQPDTTGEPVLAVDNIRGNIAGFNKDHQTMLFLKITDAGIDHSLQLQLYYCCRKFAEFDGQRHIGSVMLTKIHDQQKLDILRIVQKMTVISR